MVPMGRAVAVDGNMARQKQIALMNQKRARAEEGLTSLPLSSNKAIHRDVDWLLGPQGSSMLQTGDVVLTACHLWSSDKICQAQAFVNRLNQSWFDPSGKAPLDLVKLFLKQCCHDDPDVEGNNQDQYLQAYSHV